MGKYDRIFQSDNLSTEKLTPEESVAAIAVVTAGADTPLNQVELEFLVDTIWGFEIFEEYSDPQLLAMLEKLVTIANSEGLGSLFNAAYESLADELILDGFAAGVSVLVDETTENIHIPKDKMPLLRNLQSALDLEYDEAQEVIDNVILDFEEAEDDELDDEGEILNLEFYESPLNNFVVAVPVNLQEGARINTQEGLVGFSDDYGTLLRIDYYPFPPDKQADIQSTGKEEFFRSIILEKYVPQAIVANLATAKVKHMEYLVDTMEGAFFAVVDMPGGSTISKTNNNGNVTRLNAYRGLLTFIDNNFLYILTSQRTFFTGQTPGDIDEEAEKIKQDIFDFLDSIDFY